MFYCIVKDIIIDLIKLSWHSLFNKKTAIWLNTQGATRVALKTKPKYQGERMRYTKEKIEEICDSARLGKNEAKAYFTVKIHGLNKAVEILDWSEGQVKRLYHNAATKVASIGEVPSGRQKLSNKKPNMDGEY